MGCGASKAVAAGRVSDEGPMVSPLAVAAAAERKAQECAAAEAAAAAAANLNQGGAHTAQALQQVDEAADAATAAYEKQQQQQQQEEQEEQAEAAAVAAAEAAEAAAAEAATRRQEEEELAAAQAEAAAEATAEAAAAALAEAEAAAESSRLQEEEAAAAAECRRQEEEEAQAAAAAEAEAAAAAEAEAAELRRQEEEAAVEVAAELRRQQEEAEAAAAALKRQQVEAAVEVEFVRQQEALAAMAAAALRRKQADEAAKAVAAAEAAAAEAAAAGADDEPELGAAEQQSRAEEVDKAIVKRLMVDRPPSDFTLTMGQPNMPPECHFRGAEGAGAEVRAYLEALPASARAAPMRLLRAEVLLDWTALKVYEDIDPSFECVDMPYSDAADDAVWRKTLVLSWRRQAPPKPAERTPKYTPMTPRQLEELQGVIEVAKGQGIAYVWIDWCCTPQYPSSSAAAAIASAELLRSKAYFARARVMAVLPAFHELPGGGLMRPLLAKASAALGARKAAKAAHSTRSSVAHSVLAEVLDKDHAAGCAYFARVWCTAERMARHGRGERLSDWLSLECWLGMAVDALARSTEGGAPQSYRRVLGSQASAKLDAILARMVAAARTQGSDSEEVPEGLGQEVAELLELAVGLWASPNARAAEAPSQAWLDGYLAPPEARLGAHEARQAADRVWAFYGYYGSGQQQAVGGGAEALQAALGELAEAAGGDVQKYRQGLYVQLGLAEDEEGVTLLHDAVRVGRLDLAKALLSSGADPTAKNSKGWTPLHEAASRGHLEMMRVLIEAGAGKDAKDAAGMSAMLYAAAGGHMAVVEVLQQAGADWHASDPSGLPPLVLAASGGHMDVMTALLKAEAWTDEVDQALAWVCRHPADRSEVAKALCQWQANKELKDKNGWTPLHNAVMHRLPETVRGLLEKGANIWARTSYGMTALFVMASKEGEQVRHVARVLQPLLAAGAHIDARDLADQTPLMCASAHGAVVVVKALLAAGANKELRAADGRCALDFASTDAVREALSA